MEEMEEFELPLADGWWRHLKDQITAEIKRKFRDIESVTKGPDIGEIICITNAGEPISGKLYDYQNSDGKLVRVTIAGREEFIFQNPHFTTDHFDSE